MSRGLVALFRFRFGKPEKVRKKDRKKDRKKLQRIEGAGIAKLYLRLKNRCKKN